MKTHQREILLYYNPESGAGKRTVGHAMAISDHVRPFTFDKIPSTSTSWQQILEALHMHPRELMNQDDPEYVEKFRDKEFDEEGWLNVLRENLHLLRAPIAVRGKEAVLCERPTDIHKLIDTSKDSARKKHSPP